MEVSNAIYGVGTEHEYDVQDLQNWLNSLLDTDLIRAIIQWGIFNLIRGFYTGGSCLFCSVALSQIFCYSRRHSNGGQWKKTATKKKNAQRKWLYEVFPVALASNYKLRAMVLNQRSTCRAAKAKVGVRVVRTCACVCVPVWRFRRCHP